MDPSTATGGGDYASVSVVALSSSELLIPAFFTVGSLVLFLWEVSTRSRNDIRILRSFKRQQLQNYTYALSRVFTFAYIIATIVFQAAPLGTCNQAFKATSALYLISASLTSLLSYYRIRTLFLNDGYISTTFGFLWICVVGGSTTLFSGLIAITVGTTKHCTIFPAIPPYVSAFLIGPLLDTSLVFMFIAARLTERCQMIVSANHGVGKFITANFSTVIFAGLLQEGQGLYMSTVLIQLMTLILFLLGTSITARIVMLSLNLTIFNAATCRVYVSSQMRRFEEESARKTKIILARGGAAPTQDGELALPYLGGVKVTQTVETFS